MLIRTARCSDLDQLLELSEGIRSGMTTMPNDRATWIKKLELVEASIHKNTKSASGEIYFLVMEHEGMIIGTCGIYAGVGLKSSFYSYKLSRHVTSSEQLDMTITTNSLNLVNDFTGETELTSLYVRPDQRQYPRGQAMSRSRFMLINDFPQRFSNTLFAEIRGWMSEKGESPFWNSLGKKFFNMPYHKADFISAVNGSQFISDLMPKHPIYLELLDREARDVVGRPHQDSAAAMKLLINEGFRYKGYVDIFDAGPVMQCDRENVKSIQEASFVQVEKILPDNSQVLSDQQHGFIISNGRLENYGCTVSVLAKTENKGVVIPEICARILNLSIKDSIQTLPLR